MLLTDLHKKGLISPPDFLIPNTQYLVITGSQMYGMKTEDSDMDIVGLTIPRKEVIFPHLSGEILDFGNQKQRFNQWIQHHVEDKSDQKQYDFTIYSIVRYFHLAMENNPNMIEILYAPQNCVLHCTEVGHLIRENRKIFLHKGAKHKYIGYAFAMIHKAKSQTREGKRKEVVDKYGYDLKFATHCIRLLNQGIQILERADLDPQEDREKLKSVRRGEWTWEKIEEEFSLKEKQLEELYIKSPLPYKPDEEQIKALLLECLEKHYGKLGEDCIVRQDTSSRKLQEIRKILESP